MRRKGIVNQSMGYGHEKKSIKSDLQRDFGVNARFLNPSFKQKRCLKL
jgi:hypothetical protein